MTSTFYCISCQQHILGFISDGCTVCKKKISKKFEIYILFQVFIRYRITY